VEPSPVDPIAALLEAAVPPAAEPAPGELALMRSEKRFVEPRVAPRLLAAELELLAPEVSADAEVLVLALVEAIAVVDAVTADEAADTFEAFELEFRDDIRLPLMLPRSPLSRGAMSAEKRSAWMVPLKRMVWWRSPNATTAVRTAVKDGPPPFSGAVR